MYTCVLQEDAGYQNGSMNPYDTMQEDTPPVTDSRAYSNVGDFSCT